MFQVFKQHVPLIGPKSEIPDLKVKIGSEFEVKHRRIVQPRAKTYEQLPHIVFADFLH